MYFLVFWGTFWYILVLFGTFCIFPINYQKVPTCKYQEGQEKKVPKSAKQKALIRGTHKESKSSNQKAPKSTNRKEQKSFKKKVQKKIFNQKAPTVLSNITPGAWHWLPWPYSSLPNQVFNKVKNAWLIAFQVVDTQNFSQQVPLQSMKARKNNP